MRLREPFVVLVPDLSGVLPYLHTDGGAGNPRSYLF